MEFFIELFNTYQSLPDWLKLLWLLVPPGFTLALSAQVLHYRLACRKLDTGVAHPAARENPGEWPSPPSPYSLPLLPGEPRLEHRSHPALPTSDAGQDARQKKKSYD